MEMFWKCSEKISEIIDVKCRALFFAISTLGKVSLKTWRRRCCYKGTESRYSRVRRNVGLSIHSRDVRIMKKKKKKRKREREREREREDRLIGIESQRATGVLTVVLLSFFFFLLFFFLLLLLSSESLKEVKDL